MKEQQTDKVYVCKKFLKKDGKKVRKAAKNEIMILKMYGIIQKRQQKVMGLGLREKERNRGRETVIGRKKEGET